MRTRGEREIQTDGETVWEADWDTTGADVIQNIFKGGGGGRSNEMCDSWLMIFPLLKGIENFIYIVILCENK